LLPVCPETSLSGGHVRLYLRLLTLLLLTLLLLLLLLLSTA
jgi:hypothetical protein